MDIERTESVYNLINLLCLRLIDDLVPIGKKGETSGKKLRVIAYEILLRKSQRHSINKEFVKDPYDAFNLIQLELYLRHGNSPDIRTTCQQLEESFHQLLSSAKTASSSEDAIMFLNYLRNTRDIKKSSQLAHRLPPPMFIPGEYGIFSTKPECYDFNTGFIQPTQKEPIFFRIPNLNEPTNPYLQEYLRSEMSVKIDYEFNIFNIKRDLFNNNDAVLMRQKTDHLPDCLETGTASDSFCEPSLRKEEEEKTIKRFFNWNWEFLGWNNIPVEKPFASETNSIHHLQETIEQHLGGKLNTKIVSAEQFLTDLKNLTVGIQSDSFYRDESLEFHLKSDLTLAEISPMAMKEFIVEFLQCGTCYTRLQRMLKKTNGSLLCEGFLYKALSSAIEIYLLMFRKFVFACEDKSLIQFHVRMKQMIRQISILSHILPTYPNMDLTVNTFIGSKFLGYLFREIQKITQKESIMLLVYILQKCCHVYFIYLQKWMFHGILDDPCNELFICFLKHQLIKCKDSFDKEFFIRTDSVPGFFQGYENEILQCGKYTMLLKLFNPTHHLFSVEMPSIDVCLTFEDIRSLVARCKEYEDNVRKACGKPITVKDMYETRNEKRKQFLEMVSEKNRKTLENWSIERKILAKEVAAEKKKRQVKLNKQLLEARQKKIVDRRERIRIELEILKAAKACEDICLKKENAAIQQRIEYYKELETVIENNRKRNQKSQPIISIRDDGNAVKETEDFFENFTHLSNGSYFTKPLPDKVPILLEKRASDNIHSAEIYSNLKRNRDKILGSNAMSNILNEKNSADVEVTTSNSTKTEEQEVKMLNGILSSDDEETENKIEYVNEGAQSVVKKSPISLKRSDLNRNRDKILGSNITTTTYMKDKTSYLIETTKQNLKKLNGKIKHDPKDVTEGIDSPPDSAIHSLANNLPKRWKKSASDNLNLTNICTDFNKNRDKVLGTDTMTNILNQNETEKKEEQMLNEKSDEDTDEEFIDSPVSSSDNEYQSGSNKIPASLKRSASDYFNSNETSGVVNRNRNKIIGSNTMASLLAENQEYCTSTRITSSNLTEAQKNKLKILNTEFGFDVTIDQNSNQTEKKMLCSKNEYLKPTELEKNREHMMHSDNPFRNLNRPTEIKNLSLDLVSTDLAKNRKKVLESEFHLLTGEPIKIYGSTPMSISSDSPAVDECEIDHLQNANQSILNNNSNLEDASLSDKITCDTSDKSTQIPTKQINDPYQFSRNLIEKHFKVEPNEDCFRLQNMEKSMTSDNRNANIPKLEENFENLGIITLTDFLQKSITVPMQSHLTLLNDEILKIYLKNLDILGHFESLRNYFLLMDGEFSSLICNGIISRLENGSKPNELLNYQTLYTTLENAIVSSILGNDKNAENLSFIVADLPESFDLSSPSVLSILSLSYRVKWPLNLILDAKTLNQYADIFIYLFKVRRISWILDASYQMLKENNKRFGNELLVSPQYRRVQHIRNKLHHFVHALKQHITSSALQASWKTFQDDLLAARSMEDLYRKHTNYIKRIRFLCMLNRQSAEFHNTIENIFKIILRFYRNLKAKEWKKSKDEKFFKHSRYEKLLQDENDFEKLIKYTIYLGNKIVRHGYQYEIGEFIQQINFNRYYSTECK